MPTSHCAHIQLWVKLWVHNFRSRDIAVSYQKMISTPPLCPLPPPFALPPPLFFVFSARGHRKCTTLLSSVPSLTTTPLSFICAALLLKLAFGRVLSYRALYQRPSCLADTAQRLSRLVLILFKARSQESKLTAQPCSLCCRLFLYLLSSRVVPCLCLFHRLCANAVGHFNFVCVSDR